MENNAVLLDVRTPEEHESGYLEGAVLLPLVTSRKITDNIERSAFICYPFSVYFAVGKQRRFWASFIAPRL